jgi:hypothetical protein
MDIGVRYLLGDRRIRDRLRSQRFIYNQLLRRWVHLPHTGHFIQPYKMHFIPVSVLQRREQRHVRRFLQKARKAQVSWLVKQPKWIKTDLSVLTNPRRIIYMDLLLIDNF